MNEPYGVSVCRSDFYVGDNNVECQRRWANYALTVIRYGNAEIRTSVSLRLRRSSGLPAHMAYTEILIAVATEMLNLICRRNWPAENAAPSGSQIRRFSSAAKLA
jgi:hypothetical protein